MCTQYCASVGLLNIEAMSHGAQQGERVQGPDAGCAGVCVHVYPMLC